MIIRKKGAAAKKSSSSKSTKSSSNTKKSSVIKKEERILDTKQAKNTNEEMVEVKPREVQKVEAPKEEVEEFEKIDISSIEFKERVERRRGERRRGYRRIDERSLVSRAQQEAHTIKELASREGYQNGLKKAQKEIEEIKDTLIEFLSLKDEVYEKLYPHIMEISLAAAQKIIKKEVELSQDILKDIIVSTLDELNSDVQKVEIKVHPSDFEFAKASLPELIATRRNHVRMSVSQDNTIEAGSCLIVANNGVIDANFKTQLAVLQNAFGIYKGGL